MGVSFNPDMRTFSVYSFVLMDEVDMLFPKIHPIFGEHGCIMAFNTQKKTKKFTLK